jgi:hypothetical protein
MGRDRFTVFNQAGARSASAGWATTVEGQENHQGKNKRVASTHAPAAARLRA